MMTLDKSTAIFKLFYYGAFMLLSSLIFLYSGFFYFSLYCLILFLHIYCQSYNTCYLFDWLRKTGLFVFYHKIIIKPIMLLY